MYKSTLCARTGQPIYVRCLYSLPLKHSTVVVVAALSISLVMDFIITCTICFSLFSLSICVSSPSSLLLLLMLLSFFVCIYCVETIVAPLGYIIRMICIHFLLLIAYIHSYLTGVVDVAIVTAMALKGVVVLLVFNSENFFELNRRANPPPSSHMHILTHAHRINSRNKSEERK